MRNPILLFLALIFAFSALAPAGVIAQHAEVCQADFEAQEKSDSQTKDAQAYNCSIPPIITLPADLPHTSVGLSTCG